MNNGYLKKIAGQAAEIRFKLLQWHSTGQKSLESGLRFDSESFRMSQKYDRKVKVKSLCFF
jgi:hypothetical protein